MPDDTMADLSVDTSADQSLLHAKLDPLDSPLGEAGPRRSACDTFRKYFVALLFFTPFLLGRKRSVCSRATYF